MNSSIKALIKTREQSPCLLV